MRPRRAVLQISPKPFVPRRLPLYNSRRPLTPPESTLLQVLIPLHFISSRINTYPKQGGGEPLCRPQSFTTRQPYSQICHYPVSQICHSERSEESAVSSFSVALSLPHYLVTSLLRIPKILRAHTNVRNSSPLYALLHSSLYTHNFYLSCTFGDWPALESCGRLLAVQWAKGFSDFQEDLAEPHASGIGMVARGVKDIFVKSADVERDREGVNMENSRVGMDEAFRQYCGQIGLRDYVQGLQVMRNS